VRTPQKADGDLLLDQRGQAERQIRLVQQLDEPKRGIEQGGVECFDRQGLAGRVPPRRGQLDLRRELHDRARVQREHHAEKGLAGIGKKTRIDTTSTKSLGFFQKNEHVFSAMSVNDANISGRMVTTLMTLSVVYVKQRLFYVYVYKMFPDDSAQKDLVTFTRRFTAGIVAANK